MQQINAYWLYELGELLGRVRGGLEMEETPEDVVALVAITVYSLQYFADDKWVPLSITKQTFAYLAEELKKAMTTTPPGIMLTSASKNALRHKLDAVRQVLSRELPHTPTYYVPKRLGYSTDSLLQSPGDLFGELYGDLETIAKEYIEAAARCFAFGLGTASAFHMLRACELVLLEYCLVCGMEKSGKGGSWAGYIGFLGTMKDLPNSMRRRLDRLREYDRNELMHPGKFLSPDESDDLFDYVKSSMRDMIRDIKRRRVSGSS